MKKSGFLLWALAAVLAALAVVVSCADSGTTECDLAACVTQCQNAGRAGGECRSGSCYCNDIPPPADADADADSVDTPLDIIDTPPVDVPPDIPPEVDVREDADRPDDRYVPDDPGTSTDEGGSSEDGGGEAKSGCDPLTCFMVCGGNCDLSGNCVCAE